MIYLLGLDILSKFWRVKRSYFKKTKKVKSINKDTFYLFIFVPTVSQ